MSHKLKNELLKAFSGKMENRQAFIMQFVMKSVQRGNPPPEKEHLDKAINDLIQEGTFEEKGDLLILKKNSLVTVMEEEEDIPVKSHLENDKNYSKIQILILEAFQGTFENKSAILMNVTMKEVSKGKAPPSKDELDTAINDLIKRGVLERKDETLIKKK